MQRAICSYLVSILHPEAAQFFAIPNENDGSARMGARLNSQGRKKGVADMLVVYDGRAFFIEVKADKPHKGYQSPEQMDFEAKITAVGAKYGVARSVDDCAALLDLWGIPTREKRA